MPIVRHSRKRDALLRIVQATDCHPTAEWVFRELRKEYPGISLGTVYRNLNQLCENGLIQRLGVEKGQERFDGCVSPHAHFICNHCGEVTDLPDKEPGKRYLRDMSAQHRFSVSGYELTLRGTCKHCSQINNL